ncbi:HAMP domain-containing protein [Geomonas sp. Red32]|uniref:HAMP domain-containing protein n=1 Tax=Geomonas sp. Red32 TaxID=2912856 RepID=UPI00202CEB94|nr:HAMP domain-containing protein [Geomonas sp. Red32]MCM0083110.1 HAMP domain-containing protein [Geomonas sp. Red32]
MADKAHRGRFTLVQKLVASYSAMVVFTTAALIFAILGLFSLNRTAREIAHNNLVFIDSVNKLRASIIAQERSAGKYSILKESEFLTLFQRRQVEFNDVLKRIQKSHPEDKAVLDMMYADFASKSAPVLAGKTADIGPVQNASKRIVTFLDRLYGREQAILGVKVQSADREETSTVRWAVVLALSGFILAIAVAAYSVLNISSAIGKLKKATHRIADGDFDYDPKIPPGDEIGELARDFTGMAARLKVLEQISLDASPLTRLPGNIAIERALCRRLAEGAPFAVYYADLDNFKAFNDRYGCIQASAVIKMSGEVIEQAVRMIADEDAFVGHVGGDDFVIVADCEPADELCKRIIADFEAEIAKYYSADDLARGAIEGLDRYGVQRVFPIMTLSIAIVECNCGEYSSATDIAKAAAEIKDHVKVFDGSNYMFNRRRVSL